MVTKAQLQEKIKELENLNLDLEKLNKKLIKENQELNNKNIELENKKEYSYQKITDLKFKLENITYQQVQKKYKDTISYYKKLIEELKEKINKLENEKKLILGRKPFEDNNIIELMYELYLKNNSFNEIANYLNEKNICTRRGGNWSKSSVSLILKKEENIRKHLKTKDKYNKFFELIENNKRNKNIKGTLKIN